MSRMLWILCISALALAGVLSACVSDTEPSPATAQCYWLSNEGEGWVQRPDLADPHMCFEMDSCSGGAGYSGGGCYKWAIGADGRATPWGELGVAAVDAEEAEQAASGAACYIQSESYGGVWLLVSGAREATCFARDTCSGGLGREEGLCLKWAMSAEAPALPWSRTLTHPRPTQDVPPPQDLYAGSYEMTSECPEQGCDYGPARFAGATPLYARQDTRSRVITTVPIGECALKTGDDALLSAPRRGVVLETIGAYEAGDVIYLTNYEGEGYSTVWRRGEYLEYHDDIVVRWDQGQDDPRSGYWVEVTRVNGQTGWARNPEISERDCAFTRR